MHYQQECQQQTQLFKKYYLSGTTALIISNKEIKDSKIKVVKSIEEAGLSIIRIVETITNEVKEQK